jgi:hypothetical protein
MSRLGLPMRANTRALAGLALAAMLGCAVPGGEVLWLENLSMMRALGHRSFPEHRRGCCRRSGRAGSLAHRCMSGRQVTPLPTSASALRGQAGR